MSSIPDNVMAPREAFGRKLVEIASKNKNVVAIDADLASSTKLTYFKDSFPDRFIEVGIAEQNMLGISAGLALSGLVPVCGSFATFISRRACDQVASLAGHTMLNIKIIGAYGGLVSGNNGATHQAIEDIAIMRAIPNIVVVEPADDIEMFSALPVLIEHQGPVYIRSTRDVWPRIHSDSYRFEIGKGSIVREGKDVTIVTMGMMGSLAVKAAEVLEKEGISAEILNMACIKPFDKDTLVKSIRKTGCVVTAENHNILGGLGSAVAEVISEEYPVPLVRVGMADTYGECGDNNSLLNKYGMSASHIETKVKEVISRKIVN